jgi:hypothetical protein
MLINDFEKIFGKPASEMDEGEFKMAVQGAFYLLAKRLDDLNGKAKSIPWLQRLAWAATVVIPAIICWLIYLTKSFFGMR